MLTNASTWITKRHYEYIIIVIFLFTTTILTFDDTSEMLNWNTYMGYPAICDREYRTRYFNDDEHRVAVAMGMLYEPSEYLPDNDDEHFLNSDQDSSSADSDVDDEHEDSPMFSMNANPAVANFLVDDDDDDDDDEESTEFMNDDDEDNDDEESLMEEIFDWRKNLATRWNNRSYVHDARKKWKSHERSRKDRGGSNEFREFENLFRERRIVRSMDEKCYWKNGDGGLRSKVRVNDGFYTMMDTFGPMWNGRRDNDGDDYATAVGKIKRRRDRCESLRRIVGGFTVPSAEVLPYMAFVDSGCGGSIIGKSWVITAGHCVDDEEPKYVHVGSIKLMTGCQYNIDYIYVHPHFSRKNLDYDVALLKINPNFVYSPAIKPIALSSAKAVRKSCGVVAGWGAEEYKGAPRIMLSMTTIPVVSKRECRKFGIKKGQFCAGYEDARSDACQGDSGGPFVVNDVLVGIVSYGYKCARPHTPGVYVDVFYHRDWIHSITGF